ncbi:MAG: hypothetical protein HUU03_09455 [Planctomycetaceae bacterium]|nr:hypothetical protein [Planctomycetaceae bacterium]
MERTRDVVRDELVAFAKEHLARYKAPRWVEFRNDALPRNDRDKIDRKKLRSEDQQRGN